MRGRRWRNRIGQNPAQGRVSARLTRTEYALGSILQGHRPASAKQVDLHEVSGTLEQRLALGHILLAIRAALVRRAEQFKHRDQLAAQTISGF
jgi:hypothetical protein